MREQKIRLYNGVTNIDDALIEEAQDAAPRRGAWQKKAARTWIKWGMAAACAALVIALGTTALRGGSPGSSGGTSGASGSSILAGDDGIGSGGSDGITTPQADDGSGGTMPGGIRPVLRIGDTLYRWAGMAMPAFINPSGQVTTDGSPGVQTVLPEGFTEYAEITGVTREEPTDDLQLQAGFEASGTVYMSGEHPEVVYVRMTTGWFEGQYVRFTSEGIGPQIAYHGKLYRIGIGYSGESGYLRELPDSFEQLGTLRYIGQDSVPEGDLETNCRSDTYAMPLDGRTVYADLADEGAIYVYERQYWSGGEYDMWLRCPLWEN